MEDNREKTRLDEIKVIRNYKVLQLVRKVGSRATYAAESKKNPTHIFSISVVDMIDSTELDKNMFLNEIRLFASVNHPFILRFHESFVDKKNGLIW